MAQIKCCQTLLWPKSKYVHKRLTVKQQIKHAHNTPWTDSTRSSRRRKYTFSQGMFRGSVAPWPVCFLPGMTWSSRPASGSLTHYILCYCPDQRPFKYCHCILQELKKNQRAKGVKCRQIVLLREVFCKVRPTWLLGTQGLKDSQIWLRNPSPKIPSAGSSNLYPLLVMFWYY